MSGIIIHRQMQGEFIFVAPPLGNDGTFLVDGARSQDLLRSGQSGVLKDAPTFRGSGIFPLTNPDDALGFFTDRAALGAAFRRQRIAAGLSTRDIASWLGVSFEYVNCFERGTIENTHTAHFQKLCTLYGLRTNFLPYTGDLMSNENQSEYYVLSEPERIIQNTLIRLSTLGLTREETDEYLGISLDELGRRIANPDGLDFGTWEILTDRLHLRIIPPASERLNGKNVQQLYQSFEQLQEKWEMTDVEFIEYLKTRGIAIYSRGNLTRCLKKPSMDYLITPVIAQICGWQNCHDLSSLPEFQGIYYPDSTLANAIQHQLNLLDWSYAALGKHVGNDANGIKNMLARLCGSTENAEDPFIQRGTLERTCALLKIVCWNRHHLETIYVHSTGDKLEDAAKLGELLASVRKRQRYTRKEWSSGMKVHYATLKILETLSTLARPARRKVLNDSMIHSLETALEKSGIVYDPFHHLARRAPSVDRTALAFADDLHELTRQCLVSNRSLAKSAGLDGYGVREAAYGHYAADHPTARRLSLLLRRYPPEPHCENETRGMTLTDNLCGLRMADTDASEFSGISLTELQNLRCGADVSRDVLTAAKLLLRASPPKRWATTLSQIRTERTSLIENDLRAASEELRQPLLVDDTDAAQTPVAPDFANTTLPASDISILPAFASATLVKLH